MLLEFLLTWAREYQAANGPTTRLEERLTQTGRAWGYATEVFATPTGVFLSLHRPDEEPHTALTRVKGTRTDLSRLCLLERVMDSLLARKITLRTALEALSSALSAVGHYRSWHGGLAALVAGFAVSYGYYQRTDVGLVAAAITLLTWSVTFAFTRKNIGNPVFSDFMAIFLALLAAAGAHWILPVSVEAYAVGALVLLVPGLLITSAVAELADMNLVSGTAKLMQGFLSLLALALAWFLFTELSAALGMAHKMAPAVPRTPHLWVAALAMGVSATAFGVLYRVPPRSLLPAAACGFAGWAILKAMAVTPVAGAGTYLASVTVGLMALTVSRLSGLPSQVYSVPGISALLPGMIALSSFRHFLSGDESQGMEFAAHMGITAISIVFGLITARIPFQIAAETRRRSVA
ncbi:MAG: threonine/serine exporter family protein [Bdellovibrionales bacterium]|nr:threonine/serine exporter family protein [Bdellovibrionales bacterium]